MSDKDAEDPAENLIDNVQIEPINDSVYKNEQRGGGVMEQKLEDDRPSMTSEKWSDYAMKHFADDELVDGCPNIDGLRRVAEKLLGPIVYSGVMSVFPATPENDFRATVVYSVKIKFAYPEEGESAYLKTFQDVADVYAGNTDIEFARYPAATAATRAEGRVLRKALRLKRVVSAEEISDVPIEQSGLVENSKINEQQKFFLAHIAKRNNINLAAYISGYAKLYKFKSYEMIPYSVAIKMVAKLSEWQRDNSKIPEKLIGYETNWKEKVKYDDGK